MTHILSKQPKHKRFCLERICGNCLERLGIHNEGGGFAIIDRNAECKVGDVVHCLKHNENIRSYLKQVKRIEENNIIVGTAYYDKSKDFEFEAGEILGVVIETFGASFGNYREYVRPTHLRKKNKRGEPNEMPHI